MSFPNEYLFNFFNKNINEDLIQLNDKVYVELTDFGAEIANKFMNQLPIKHEKYIAGKVYEFLFWELLKIFGDQVQTYHLRI